MSESSTCLNARALLPEIHTLKKAYDLAYEDAQTTGSKIAEIQTIKTSLETKINTIKEQLGPVEIERTFRLREQYDFQVKILKKAKMVEARLDRDTSGHIQETLFIKDAEGNEYPLPSFRTILKMMMEKRALLEVKADQEFTQLLLVPFGIPLETLINKFREYLHAYNQYSHPSFVINSERPVSTSSYITEQRIHIDLIYDLVRHTKNSHGGKTKEAILKEEKQKNTWNKGWRLSFMQSKQEGKGEIKEKINKREDMIVGETPSFYLEKLQHAYNDPSHLLHGESGITPEEWIMAFIGHLEETGKAFGLTSATPSSLLIGCFYPSTHEVLYGLWSTISHQAVISEEHIMNAGSGTGALTVVRI